MLIGSELYSIVTYLLSETKTMPIGTTGAIGSRLYTKTLTKNQVCEIFQMRDIGKNGLPKFIKLCIETPRWCPFQEHQYGRRKPTETAFPATS